MKKLIYTGKWYNFMSGGFDSVTLRLFKKSWDIKTESVYRRSIRKYEKALPLFQPYRIEGVRSRKYKV